MIKSLNNSPRFMLGVTDAWGSIEGQCIKQPVTEKNYRDHLEARISLGCYMLLDSGECHFSVIDLDEKEFGQSCWPLKKN